jgi:hypothetical protein
MEEFTHLILKTYGIVGIIILAPYLAVVFLWKENVRLNNLSREREKEFTLQLDEMGKRATTAQEKRVEDSQVITNKVIEMVTEHVAQAKETTTALDRVGDMVSMLTAQINGIQPTTPHRRLSGGGGGT